VAEFVTSIDIEASPEIVFAHLVTPEGMCAWMGQHAELDATPGGVFAVDIEGTPVRGEFLEVDPPRLVVVSWGVPGNEQLPPGSSRVEFRLTPIAAGTRLDLSHTDLPAAERPPHAQGWTHFLARLAATAAG
jgi:uncharacterized protein YndB with AHSA1/START domain